MNIVRASHTSEELPRVNSTQVTATFYNNKIIRYHRLHIPLSNDKQLILFFAFQSISFPSVCLMGYILYRSFFWIIFNFSQFFAENNKKKNYFYPN